MESGFQLKVLEGQAAGQKYLLDRADTLVGRAAPLVRDVNYVHINDDTVSLRHAHLRWENGIYRLTNLCATNPIRVNDQLAKDYLLKAGDRVRLGECLLLVESTIGIH